MRSSPLETHVTPQEHKKKISNSKRNTIELRSDFPPSVALVADIFVLIRRNDNTLRFGSG
jgi:hypothetical protein